MSQPTNKPNKSNTEIISLNSRGLNLPEKRSQVLLSLHRNKADIVFLQETHFKTNSVPKLSNQRFPIALHATNHAAKTKGVSILIAKQCQFQITDTYIDGEARFIFVKGTLYGRRITLANIYAPNAGQAFFRATLQKLSSFQEGLLILGGDFNVSPNPLLDTSTGTSTMPYKALRAIKTKLQELSLHDAWRTLYPDTKDYTFYSTPHNRHSRLDYLFLSQTDLPCLTAASIDPMYLSDHHPISMTLQLTNAPRKQTPIWCLDPSLLTDAAITSSIDERLVLYFQENNSPDISPMMRWESHKSTIRGELISISATRRKERNAHITRLTARILELERTHKNSQAVGTLLELIQNQKELLETLNKRIKRNYILSQKTFYEYGNKSSKLLARALQAKKASMTIHSLTDAKGQKIVSNDQIAEQFIRYYSQLYNLRTTDPLTDYTDRLQLIRDFLSKYCPDPLSAESEQPISSTEIDLVLKQLKPGKSPGPDGLTTVITELSFTRLNLTFYLPITPSPPKTHHHETYSLHTSQ